MQKQKITIALKLKLNGIFILFALFSSMQIKANAQKDGERISRSQYIEMYKAEAIKEMQRSRVPASITLAQGILESGDGNSLLARKAKNHFGIKCHSDWNGKTFHKDDDAKDECFRKYKTVLESYRDHSEFLQKKRYAFLFDLETTDYKGWARGLKKAGYATNPKYPQLLIRIIEENNLYQYDQLQAERSKKSARRAMADAKSNQSEKRILTHENRIKYIVVQPDDSFEKLENEFQMNQWQFYKYNDLEKGSDLYEEGVLYLQPKRNCAKEDYHIVEEGESMWEISQQYGIKLKKLYKKNRMEKGEEPKAGQKLSLRKRIARK